MTETAPTAVLIPGTHNYDNYLDCKQQRPIPQFVARLVVLLRDGRKLFGILRSFDQFGNLLLQDTHERFYVDLEYAEEYRGVFLIRGENVALVGQLVARILSSV